MKVRREDIIQNLQSMVSVIEKKQTIPILSDILIKTEGASILMIGTDLEIQLSTRVAADVTRPGETTVSARKFFDICRNLPDNCDLMIELKEELAHIQSGRSRFRLATRNPKDFPEFSTDPYDIDLQIVNGKLLKLLQATNFCMATHDVRYYLNGLMIEVNPLLFGAVASNGHRLAMYNEKLEQSMDIDTRFIIPRKGVMELLRLLDGDSDQIVRLRVSNSNIEINVNEKVFLSKLIDGKFPDFKSSLSQPIAHNFILKTLEFKSALTRVSVLSSEKFKKITLKFFHDTLLIRTDNNEQEQADEEIDIDHPGENYEVSLNISYLLEAITNIHHATVEISFTEKTDICLIGIPKETKLNYVIMPLV
ncbi:DNA polymerase III subunit beta [bacterium]|nr:DNA polymerase III subunit beta [bacterium]